MTTKTPSSKRSPLDRRRVLKGMAAASVALAGFPYIAKAKPATMTVPNSGGALEEAFKVAYFDTFQKKTGIQILGAPYMDTARVKALLPWGEEVGLLPAGSPHRFFALVPLSPARRAAASVVTYILTDHAHNRTAITVNMEAN